VDVALIIVFLVMRLPSVDQWRVLNAGRVILLLERAVQNEISYDYLVHKNSWKKRNFHDSARNGGKNTEMRKNSAKSGMVGMSDYVTMSTNTTKPISSSLPGHISTNFR